MKKIIIVGAGISGLSLAYFLQKLCGDRCHITLIEKERRVGGWIRTYNQDGFLFEQGPRGFRTKGKGAVTAQLAQELGLSLIHASPSTKKRYVAREGHLEEVNLCYLLQRPGLWPALLEPFKKRGHLEDESIASFFRRRFAQSYVDHLLYPVCQGIFAEDPEELSMRACCAPLWQAEQEVGSLIKAWWKKRDSSHIPPLSSFPGGMESLPLALAKRLQGSLLLGEEVEQILPNPKGVTIQLKDRRLEGDHLFLATPNLFNLAPSLSQKQISLTSVNVAFSHKVLRQDGFGFLTGRPRGAVLGISFDSKIFAEHNRPGQERLCAILKGEYEEHQAITIAQEAIHTYLKIKEVPEKNVVFVAKNAIHQYPVGHLQKVEQLEKSLSSSITLVGARLYGIAVNECIFRSHKVATTFVESHF